MQTTEKAMQYEEALRRFCRDQYEWTEAQGDAHQRRIEHYIAGLMEHEGMSYGDAYVALGRRRPGLFPGHPRLDEACPVQFIQQAHSEVQSENPDWNGVAVERKVAELYPTIYALAGLVRSNPAEFRKQCAYVALHAHTLAEGSLAARILANARSAMECNEARDEVLMKEAAERQARRGGR